jgi:hypothetical protein
MDVSFQQVRDLFAQEGFIAVLEKMAMATVSEIVAHGVSRNQPPHDGG